MNEKNLRFILVALLASIGAMNICSGQIGSSSLSNQKLKIEVAFSEPLAVFVFVHRVSSKSPDNPYKQLFADSEFSQQQKLRVLISEFERLTLDYTYEYGREKMAGSTGASLKRQLVISPTIDDFKQHALGIIPNADLFKLCLILAEFKPVYRELIYEPNQEVFERQLNELRSLIGSTDMTTFFNIGVKFYNANWDNSVPIHFVFYPLPNSRGWTAQAYLNVAESAIPTSLSEYNGLLSVIFHEIFHILYDEQSLALKKDIVQWFQSNPSRNSQYALSLMNEALATALGNGYVSAKLNGKENPGNWYRDKYINTMAKAIYPVVTQYIPSGQSMDQEFVDRYVKIYDDNIAVFAELNHIMTYRFVLSDNPPDFAIVDAKFPFNPATLNEAISVRAIEKAVNTPMTKLFLISKDNKGKLQLIKNGFAELEDWQPNADADFTHSVLLKDKTYLIMINSVKMTVGEQIESLKLE